MRGNRRTSRNGGGRGAGGAIGGGSVVSPQTIFGSSLKLWLRSDLGITLNGSNVSAWDDQSGNGNHVTQATPANQPAYNASDAAYANRPTVEATLTTHYLASGAFAVSQPCTIIFVGEIDTSFCTAISTGTSAGTNPIIFNSAGNVAINAGVTRGSGVGATTKHSTLAEFNGVTSFVGVDNWLTGGVTGDAGASAIAALGVGAYTNGTFGSVGKCAEVIILSGLATAPQKTQLAAYLAARYGLTIT